MTLALAVSTLLVAGSALAQTAPPPTQTPPPTTQTRPPTTQTPPTQVPPTGQAKPAVPLPMPQPPPAVPFPADAKVAFIDLQRIVTESKPGKKGQEAMKALNDKLASELAAKNKEIVALQDKMKQQQGVVSDAVYNSMAKELDRLQREAQFKQQDAQVQVDQLNQELLKSFQDQVLPIVEKLREERGLWIVFALGDNSNIAAAHAGLDLSPEVIKRLDATVK